MKISSDNVFVNNAGIEYKKLIGKPIVKINDIAIDKWRSKTKLFLPSENISGEYYNLIKIITDYHLSQKFFDGSDILKLTFDDGKTENISYATQVEYLEIKSRIEFKNNNRLLFYSMIGKNNDVGYLAWNSIRYKNIFIFQRSTLLPVLPRCRAGR